VRPPTPPDEPARARAVEGYDVLDTPPEPAFDDLARLASIICGTPVALVTFVHGERLWPKAKVGLPGLTGAARDDAFCAHALAHPRELLVVPDMRADPRFADNPFVRGAPEIRFYAGAPLVTAEGHALGTLCVLDRVPRVLSPEQLEALRALARQAQAQLELRRVTRQLAERNAGLARLAAIVEHSPDAILSKRPDGTILSWNAGAERLYGYAASEMVGRTAECLHPPERRDEYHAVMARLRAGEAVEQFDTVRVRKDGTRVDVSVTAAPILGDGGGVRAVSWVARDETARRAAERATQGAIAMHVAANERLRQVNEAKSNFVSIVSHEFRTPLTVIQGFAQMLSTEDFAAEEVREYATDIYEESARLARLISDMLDLDRMESGRMRLERAPVDVNAVFRDVAEQQAAAHPRHRLALHLDPALPPVLGDPDRVRQVAVNLLSNAFKYAPGGGEVAVTTACEAAAGLGACAHVVVRDEGLGVAPDALEAIFDRYARSGSTRDRAIQGTGLGLPIVREIVHLHGGRVWAESAPGQGATFHVLLPLAGPPAPAGAEGGP
jgi:PAS domain S-box-containing protein